MLMRLYVMYAAQVGLLVGTIGWLAGIAGFILPGWFVDRWYASGRRDAHLRYFVYASLLAAGFAMVAFKLASSRWVFLPAFAALHFLHPLTGPAVAHLQFAKPNQYRGRVAAPFELVFHLMGMCLGPHSAASNTSEE